VRSFGIYGQKKHGFGSSQSIAARVLRAGVAGVPVLEGADMSVTGTPVVIGLPIILQNIRRPGPIRRAACTLRIRVSP